MKFLIIALFATAASAMIAPLHTARERIDGSYIVVFKDNVDTLASISTIRDHPFFKSLGGRIDRTYEHALSGFAATLSSKALDFIRRFNFVKYVEEDQVVRAAAVGSWGLDRIDQRNLPLDGVYSYDNNESGTGATVYVIDTGILLTHDEFGGRARLGKNTHRSEDSDCNGHGTHCAGTVGGSTYGVAQGVSLVAVKVLGCLGSGSSAGVIEGMDWVTGQCGTERCVASMSLGGGAHSATDGAVSNMKNAGVTVVVAAGNDNADACNYSPARSTDAITVGSTGYKLLNNLELDRRSSFSNYGDCVNIFAPGRDIESAWIGSSDAINTISGTSMAAPHVAGAAAIILAESIATTPDDVSYRLIEDATEGVITDVSGPANLLLYVP